MASGEGLDCVEVGVVAGKVDCLMDEGLIDEGWVISQEGLGDGGAEVH